MRTKNVLLNFFASLGTNGISILLKFVIRSVFIYVLGKEYLGLSSLFTNLLSVLSISELGIGVAIVQTLYKPLADGDERKVKAVMNFLKKAYRCIGCVILLIGLIIMVFIDFFINNTTDIVNIRFYFFLYLIQSTSSYWFWAYKRSIIQADQKRYVIELITIAVTVVVSILQIVMLLLYKSFVIYVILFVASHIAINIAISTKVNKMYPYLKEKNNEKLNKNELIQMWKDVAGASLYKINTVIVKSTDNLVISKFISIAAVGIYDNYHMVISSVLLITKRLFSSATASIGNLIITEDEEKSEKFFQCFCFASFWIYGFSSVCLWVLINPFIEIWLDKSFLFEKHVVFIIVLDFLMDGFQQPSLILKDSAGLFWYGKFRPLATALLNVIISVILVQKMGVAGIIAGTVLSRLFTTWWFEPKLVYKYVFKKSPVKYFVRYFTAIGITFVVTVMVSVAASFIKGPVLIAFSLKMLLCAVVPNLIMFIFFGKTEEFNYIFKRLKNVVKRK